MKLNNILVLILFIVVFVVFLFIINQEAKIQPEKLPTVKEKAIINDKTVSNYTIMVSKDVCEGCHMSGKPFIPQALTVLPHENGGAYCLSCHVISHDKHPIDENVTCEKCHGTSAKKPQYSNGYIECNDCHNYPDPLMPSKGNLIAIHRPRGISCNTCHTDTCTKCHQEMGTGERWIKRLDHFDLMAKER